MRSVVRRIVFIVLKVYVVDCFIFLCKYNKINCSGLFVASVNVLEAWGYVVNVGLRVIGRRVDDGYSCLWMIESVLCMAMSKGGVCPVFFFAGMGGVAVRKAGETGVFFGDCFLGRVLGESVSGDGGQDFVLACSKSCQGGVPDGCKGVSTGGFCYRRMSFKRPEAVCFVPAPAPCMRRPLG
jgi:hypothetical protein